MGSEQVYNQKMRLIVHNYLNSEKALTEGINRLKLHRFILTKYPVSERALDSYVQTYYLDTGDVVIEGNLYKRVTPIEQEV